MELLVDVADMDVNGVQAVVVSGDCVYLANYFMGLQVIDVSDPPHPLRVGGCANEQGGRARDIAVCPTPTWWTARRAW